MKRTTRAGFTIVELLIVIIVIGILAGLVLIAYNSVTDQAKTTAAKNDLEQVGKQLKLYKEQSGGGTSYPADASSLSYSSGTTLQYTVNNAANPATYCVTATNGKAVYWISSTSGSPASGICPGQNLIAWDKTKVGATSWIPSATIDTSTFRTSLESLRIGPNQTGISMNGNPWTSSSGVTYTVDLWMKSDSTWNGTASNSKIRFGNSTDGSGSLLQACGYNGVKLTWTEVTCPYTLAPGVTSVSITVGNDGTTGNIWLDDITISRSSNS